MSATEEPEATVDRSAVRDPAWPESVEIYDTTLRDGSQLEGISLTVADKLRIAEQLDKLGVAYIEGGWPGANPKDDEFFARARDELELTTSEFVAFGSTRRAKGKVDSDQTLANLVAAGTGVVCIVGKCWDYHVTEALNTTLDEGVAMVADSVDYLVAQGKRVFFDAEHFFDGYKRNPEFSLRVIEAAAMAGAEAVVLCDTNGGSLPPDIESAVADVVAHVDCAVGIHLHNDTGCGVANALAAVRAGATQVQGTINGYGERVGNCDLVPIMANLELKMGVRCLPDGRLANLTSVAHHIAELVNFTPDPQQPYVGATAFAHKAGLHTSALSRRSDAYEHVAPDAVGNGTRVLVSEMAGRSTLEMKASALGLELDGKALGDIIDTLKRLEHAGYHFEAADASLELLMRGAAGWEQPYFELESFHVEMAHRSGTGARAWNEVAVDVETEAIREALGRRRAPHGDRRGQRPGQRAGCRCAGRAQRPLSGARSDLAHRLQGAGARHREGHRGDHPGPARLHRRRPNVVDHRRVGEHHRGVVAGPHRLPRLRVASLGQLSRGE